jgi:histidine kinase
MEGEGKNLDTQKQSLAQNRMSEKDNQDKADLDEVLGEYQNLFEVVPCIITVQDRDYRLVKYNRQFAEKFTPKPSDYCYQAYKGRDKPCVFCPVEKTFKDGQSHWSEETGLLADGTVAHWVVKSSPVKNSKGEIVAAMEMSLDITQMKELQEKLKMSEKRYDAIFRNIPNPVFVLDYDTFEILDCNKSVKNVYGYEKDEIIERSFLDLFEEEEKEPYTSLLRTFTFINQAKQFSKRCGTLFVNIRVSPIEHLGKKVLLVTTSDITKHLEIEQQLVQASKMATLGEMATGVAHELNQPLSVIKTASNFFTRKISKNEKIDEETFLTLSKKIGKNVDRATKIIDHMREFGRKSDVTLEKVQVNHVLNRAHEVLAQQLKLRGIEVIYDIQEDLPEIMAEPIRLEQVFINLLVNARDAIEEKLETTGNKDSKEKIILRTHADEATVTIEVIDTGTGIPDAILEKIFEPFFTTKKVGKGTGIGLSISYGIIQDCGGRIRAISPNEGGACFVITFPRTNEGS